MQLLITPLAAYDLEEIGDYIAQENPFRAGSFVAEIQKYAKHFTPTHGEWRRP